MIISVDDAADPRIAAYRAIRERDLVGRADQFIAEGTVVLQRVLASPRHTLISLLIAAPRLAGLAPLLAQVPAAVPIYVAAPGVLDTIVGFAVHRGVLAVGHRTATPPVAALLDTLGQRALVLGLFGIANHDNIGGIFRNAAAFGVDAVVLDATCCDPHYRKAIRVSVGATLTVPYARAAPGEDLLAELAARDYRIVALTPAAATPLSHLRPSSRTAVLLGAEGPGLPAAVIARCATVAIPMAAGSDSLNVATTSGIVLHYLVFMC